MIQLKQRSFVITQQVKIVVAMHMCIILLLAFTFQSRAQENYENEMVDSALLNLGLIQYAEYIEVSTSGSPDDVIYSDSSRLYYQRDESTFLGGKFYSTGKKYKTIYIGDTVVSLDLETKKFILLTSENRGNEMPLVSPFIIDVETMLKYIQEGNGDHQLKCYSRADTSWLEIIFSDKYAEIIGKKVVVSDWGGEESIYRIALNNKFIPVSFERIVPRQRTVRSVTWLDHTHRIRELPTSTKGFIPANYSQYDLSKTRSDVDTLESTFPSLELQSTIGGLFRTDECNCKVLVVQLTGIGCSPCYAQLDLLKQIHDKYGTRDVTLIAIETWSKNVDAINNHILKNEINYPYFLHKGELHSILNIDLRAVPILVVVNEEREIHETFIGYTKDVDEQILESINELLEAK